MPAFVVTSPDGKRFQVNAPAGANQEDVLAYAQKQFSAAQSPEPRAPSAPLPDAAPTVNLTTGERGSIPIERPFAAQQIPQDQQQAQAASAGRSISGVPMPQAQPGEITKGLESGLDSTSAMLYGLAALVGDTTGNDSLRDWGLKYHDQYTQKAGQNAPSVASLADVHSLGDLFDYTKGMIGSSVPFMATALVGGGVGGVVGRSVARGAAERLVAKGLGEDVAAAAVKRAMENPKVQAQILAAVKRGTVVGSAAGNFATLAPLQQGELYAQLKEAGVEDAAAPAWGWGAAQGALFALPLAHMAERIVAPAGIEQELAASISRGLAGQVAKRTPGALEDIAKKTAGHAGLMGATMGAVQAIGSMARIRSTDGDWTEQDTQGLIDSAAGGAILGTIMGAPTEVIARIKSREAPAAQQGAAPSKITPEPVQDLHAQYKDMLDPTTGRDAVLVPVGQSADAIKAGDVTKGVESVSTNFGTVLTTSVEKAARLRSMPNLSSAQMAEILYNAPVTPKEASDGTVVQARDSSGNVTAQVATNADNLARDTQTVQRTAGPNAATETTTADAAIAERKARTDGTVELPLEQNATLDESLMAPAREGHVVALLQPMLQATEKGRAALARLHADPEFRRSVVDQYYAGGIGARQLAGSLSGRNIRPDPRSAGSDRTVPAYRDDLTGFLKQGGLMEADPAARLDFYRWINTDATPAQRVAYDAWQERQGIATKLTGDITGARRPPITDSTSVMGVGGEISGSIGRDGERVIAKPWQTERRAQEQMAKLEQSDIDSEYNVRHIGPAESMRHRLGGEGYYVTSHPKSGIDTFSGHSFGEHLTEPQLARKVVERATARYKALPPELKVEGKKGNQYGVKFLRIDKNGTVTPVVMDSRVIANGGLQAATELHAPEIQAPERLVRAFQRGLTLVTGYTVDGVRYQLDHTQRSGDAVKWAQPGSGRLVLREKQGEPETAVTLTRARRAYAEMSQAGETAASRGPNDLNAGMSEAPQQMGEPGQEGGRIQPTIDTTSAAGAAAIEAVPAFERGRANPSDPVLRNADTEAQQNRRSVQTVTPNDTFSERGGNSSIGVTTGRDTQATSTEPAARPAGPVRVDEVSDPTTRPDTLVQLTDSRLSQLSGRFKDFTTAVRSQVGLRSRLVVMDDATSLQTLASAMGHNDVAVAIAERLERQGAQAWGFMAKSRNSDVVYIHLNAERAGANISQMVGTLSHELGHVFFKQEWERADPAVRKALQDEHAAAMNATPRERARAQKYPAERLFEEWMADHFASWLARNQKPTNLVEHFFEKVAMGARNIIQMLIGKLGGEAQFDEFMARAVITGERGVETPGSGEFASLGVADSHYFEAQEIDGQKNSTENAWKERLGDLAGRPKVARVIDFTKDNVNAFAGTFLRSIQSRVRRMGIPAFDAIVSHFNLRPGQTGGHTYYTESNARIQVAHTRLNGILDKLKPEEQKQLLREMQSESGKYSTPRLAEIATQLHVFMDRMRQYQLDAGLPVQKVENYFPQVADTVELAKPDAYDTIKKALADANIVVDEPKLQDMIESLRDDAYSVNLDPGIVGVDGIRSRSPFAAALQPRTMAPDVRNVIQGIRDKDGNARFYAKNLHDVLYRYTTQAVRRSEHNRRLGDTTWMTDIQPDGTQRQFDPQYKLKQHLNDAVSQGATQDQVNFMDEAMQAFTGNYQRIKSESARKMVNATLTYQNLRTLGMIFFSSMPDLANIVVRTGNVMDAFRSIKNSYREAWSANKEGRTAELLRVFGHGADTVDHMALLDFSGLHTTNSKWANKVNEKFMRAIGMHRWTQFTRGLAMRAGIDYVKSHAEKAAAGDVDSLRRLRELNLSVEDVKAWAQGGEKFFGENGVAETDMAAKAVTGAVSRFINEAVVHAEPPEKTLWGNSEYWKLVWHLKNFMYGYTNRILSRVWHEMTREGATTEGRVQAALALSMSLPIAAVGMEMKNGLQYGLWGNEDKKRKQMSSWAYLETLANRSGSLGVAQYGLDIGEASARGRAPLISALGPTLGQLNDFVQYPLYRQLPGAIPGLSYFPGARDYVKEKLKGEE